MASRDFGDSDSDSDSSIADTLYLYRGDWLLIDLQYDSDSDSVGQYTLDSHSRYLECIYARAFMSRKSLISGRSGMLKMFQSGELYP